MRVTVIATGVNGIHEAETIKRPIQTVAPKAQADDGDFATTKDAKTQAGNNSGRSNKDLNRRNPGIVRKQSLPFPKSLDEAELETPTYLRQAAD